MSTYGHEPSVPPLCHVKTLPNSLPKPCNPSLSSEWAHLPRAVPAWLTCSAVVLRRHHCSNWVLRCFSAIILPRASACRHTQRSSVLELLGGLHKEMSRHTRDAAALLHMCPPRGMYMCHVHPHTHPAPAAS